MQQKIKYYSLEIVEHIHLPSGLNVCDEPKYQFFESKYVYYWLVNSCNDKNSSAIGLNRIEIPADANVYKHKFFLTTNKIVVKEFVPLKNIFTSDFITERMYLTAIKCNVNNFLMIPKAQLNETICLEAVTKDPIMIQHIADELKTKKVCMKAIESNGRMLAYVPSRVASQQMYMKAVENTGLALRYIPDTAKTKKMVCKAISNRPEMIELVPARLKTPDRFFVLTIVRKRGYTFYFRDLRTLRNFVEDDFLSDSEKVTYDEADVLAIPTSTKCRRKYWKTVSDMTKAKKSFRAMLDLDNPNNTNDYDFVIFFNGVTGTTFRVNVLEFTE